MWKTCNKCAQVEPLITWASSPKWSLYKTAKSVILPKVSDIMSHTLRWRSSNGVNVKAARLRVVFVWEFRWTYTSFMLPSCENNCSFSLFQTATGAAQQVVISNLSCWSCLHEVIQQFGELLCFLSSWLNSCFMRRFTDTLARWITLRSVHVTQRLSETSLLNNKPCLFLHFLWTKLSCSECSLWCVGILLMFHQFFPLSFAFGTLSFGLCESLGGVFVGWTPHRFHQIDMWGVWFVLRTLRHSWTVLAGSSAVLLGEAAPVEECHSLQFNLVLFIKSSQGASVIQSNPS